MIVTGADRHFKIVLKATLYRFFSEINVGGGDGVSFAEPKGIWQNVINNDSPHFKTPQQRSSCIHGGNWINAHGQKADRALSGQRERFRKGGQENDACPEKPCQTDGISGFVQT